MKKWLACLLAVLLLMQMVSVFAEELQIEPTSETADLPEALNELVVGHTTAMNGNFFNHIFGNNTVDIDVQSLLHGYYLVNWANDYCAFDYDPEVVGGTMVMENTRNGNITYTLALQKDLYYSDGTPITARDYAFSIILSAAPQIDEIGGNVNDSDFIVGMREFKNGETHVLAGVRVPSDYVLQIEIRGEYLPYFYAQGLLNYCPMPISVIAPECEIVDEGNGVFVRDIDWTPEREHGPSERFTAELLQQTLLNPESGYVQHPTLSSGPYVLTDYQPEASMATFEINPYYKGNPKGQKPSIQKLIYRLVDNDTVIDELKEGTLGLFNKAVKADVITEGLQLVFNDYAYSMSNYMRIGYSYITCCWEQPAMASKAVRQAIAHCFDTDTFIEKYVRNYGVRVFGYYGIGQWMYQLVEGQLEPPVAVPEEGASEEELSAYDAEIAAWEALSLDNVKRYEVDIEEATRLLVEDGWTLNANGEAFDPNKDEYRCKRNEDDELIELNLDLIYPEGNEFGDAVQELFVDNLKQVGIKLTATPMEFTELLKVYYREEERNVDMIYLATNFTEVFEPSNTFNPEDALTAHNNRTACDDEELYQRAVDMRLTKPGDVLEYASEWVAFQERYAEVLPTIPIYSNVYFDFYTSQLRDYAINTNIDWTEAIVGAHIDPDYMAVEPAAAPEDDEFEDDEFEDEEFEDEEFEDEELLEFDD